MFIRRTQVAVTFLIQKTHLCGCLTMGKRKLKIIHFFRFIVSLQLTTWLDGALLLQEKAGVPTSPHDVADTCPKRNPVCCLFGTLGFSL